MSQRRQRRGKPSKEAKGNKVLLRRFLLAGTAILVTVCIVGYHMAFKFLHSDGFREQVNQELSAQLGAPVVLGELKWDGLHLENDSLTAQSEGAIVNVEARGIALDVSTQWMKREIWEISGVVIQDADLELDLTKEFTQIELSPKNKNWLERMLPSQAELFDAQVLRANASIKTEGGEYSISESKVDIQKQGNIGELVLSEGQLVLPFPLLNKAELNIAKFRLVNQHLVIDQAELLVFENGKLELDGEVNLQDQDYSLFGVLDDLKCADVISEGWKQRLHGDVEATFTTKPKLNNEPEFKGNLKISDGQLTALPVLDLIAAYTVVRDFKSLRFSEFKCDFYKYGQLLKMKNIYVHCDGLIRIEGGLDIQGEQLNGKFEVGLNPGTLSHIPGAEGKIFLPGKEGMHWATVHISGTIDRVQEDLSGRLKAAALDRVFEMIGSKKVLRFTNRSLDSIGGISSHLKPSKVKGIMEKGGKILIENEVMEKPAKTGANLIQSGLESLFGGSN